MLRTSRVRTSPVLHRRASRKHSGGEVDCPRLQGLLSRKLTGPSDGSAKLPSGLGPPRGEVGSRMADASGYSVTRPWPVGIAKMVCTLCGPKAVGTAVSNPNSAGYRVSSPVHNDTGQDVGPPMMQFVCIPSHTRTGKCELLHQVGGRPARLGRTVALRAGRLTLARCPGIRILGLPPYVCM